MITAHIRFHRNAATNRIFTSVDFETSMIAFFSSNNLHLGSRAKIRLEWKVIRAIYNSLEISDMVIFLWISPTMFLINSFNDSFYIETKLTVNSHLPMNLTFEQEYNLYPSMAKATSSCNTKHPHFHSPQFP